MEAFNNKFIYFTTYSDGEKALHDLEFRMLFKDMPVEKILMSNVDFDVSRSVFTKQRIEVLCKADSVEALLKAIENLKLNYDNYKINYIEDKNKDTIHKKQIKQLRKVDFKISGEIELRKPNNLLGIADINGTIYFGNLIIGENSWAKHKWKPRSYSVSCSVRVARTIANLAMEHNLNLSVIDPCCGAGTVVLELLSIGVKPFANEINEKVSTMAKENLKYFGYDLDIKTGDISHIIENYDVVVLDLPYNHFTQMGSENQLKIIKESARIGKKLVVLTQDEMDDILSEAKYKIIDKAHVDKGNFRRYITICEAI